MAEGVPGMGRGVGALFPGTTPIGLRLASPVITMLLSGAVSVVRCRSMRLCNVAWIGAWLREAVPLCPDSALPGVRVRAGT